MPSCILQGHMQAAVCGIYATNGYIAVVSACVGYVKHVCWGECKLVSCMVLSVCLYS